ncbi:MAG: hypothetical protein AB7W37_15830 [Syntrophobacteraceae bacterium]
MRKKTKWRWLPALLACLALVAGLTPIAEASPYSNFDFDDITYWVGSGGNQAALVIEWNDGKEPQTIVWGYRWDGTATGADMLAAISGSGYATGGPFSGNMTGADSRLYTQLEWWSGYDAYTVYAFGYDVDGDGFGWQEDADESGGPADPDDHGYEGWYTGYWSYWVSDDGSEWAYSGWGISARELSDGSWDGWSYSDFASYGSGSAPGTPVSAQAPVPIPGAIWLLGSGLVGLLRLRGKRR